MRFRGKSIRRKIVALLLVPLVALTGIWGLATVITWHEADQLLEVGHVVDKVGYPIEDVARVIQEERRQTLVYLADPRASDAPAELRGRRLATDKMVAEIRTNAEDPEVSGELADDSRNRLDSILDAFDGIDALRRTVDDGPITGAEALKLYSDLIDPCYSFLMTLHALDDVDLDKQGRALVGITRARELLSREDALVSAALVAERLDQRQLRRITDLIAKRELRYDIALEVLPADERARYKRFWKSASTTPLLELEKAVVDGGTGTPRGVTAADWAEASGTVLDDLAELNTAAGDRYKERVEPAAIGILVRAGAAGVLGLIALLLSLAMSFRIGRGLVRDLTRLRKESHEVSSVRLPGVMRRLAAGEQVDVETEAPRLEYDKDELGQVGQALNTLQRAAVEAAVKQADMRRGVSEVFVNLARRSQVLLHKQLTLLDAMERRTEDTGELADLFRLDHLTTRMRRHAEGLVILSGAAPSRQWRKPVQLMDVVRAAVAEVEDYERIEVRRLPRIAVTGPAVADLTHLAAELLENATVFSPPHTAVQVHGERVANGFTLEIHDRGLGMTPDALLDANLRLAETPEFELSDTDRLGLFVVSRLAQRQHVRVALQPSPYGGTTAVVFIPDALLTEAPDADTGGMRLERGRGGERRESAPGERTGRLAQAPVPLPGISHSVLNGPIELEAPLETSGLGLGLGLDEIGDEARDLGDIEDADSGRGGLFRPRRPVPEPVRPQDGVPAEGPVPLPRRRTPKLVSSHGRPVSQGTNGVPTQPKSTTATHGTPPQNASAPATNGAASAPQSEGALPRRVRQSHLAPQLKESQTRASAPAPAAEDRDAEEVRSRMASLQRGWQRGRRDNGEAEAAPAATAPQERTQAQAQDPAQDQAQDRTTPEGDGR